MLKHTRFNTVLSSDFSLKCLKSLLLRIGIVMICEFTRDQKWVQETYMLKSNSITRPRIYLTLGLIVLGSTKLWSSSLTHLLLENGLLAVAASSIISRNGRSRKKVSNHTVFSFFFLSESVSFMTSFNHHQKWNKRGFFSTLFPCRKWLLVRAIGQKWDMNIFLPSFFKEENISQPFLAMKHSGLDK